MIIQSKNFSLKLEEFPIDEVHNPHFSDTERSVIKLINDWLDGKEVFVFNTSGSTGKPKEILIDRSKIVLSTHSTFDFIDPDKEIKNTLLCIDPKFIGGAMVVFRALIKKLDLYITEPSSNVLMDIPYDLKFDLVSLVPLQFKSLPKSDRGKFQNMIIGGASIGIVECQESNVYASYGMTETVSHVALRKIDHDHFHTVGDMKVGLNSSECLKFKGEITNHNWLDTNDLGEVISDNKFKWLGRKDFIINSGGIKINPETVELKLADQIRSDFIISSIPDDRLGEKVILIIEENEPEINFDTLDKYEIPKEVFSNVILIRTESGKINRQATRNSILQNR